MAELLRLSALEHARRSLGVAEQPPGSNRGREIDRWNAEAGAPLGSPWCAAFVHAMFRAAEFELPGGASVAALRDAAREKGWLVGRPLRGDLACFDFHEGGRYGPFADHVGFVERVLAVRRTNGRFSGWILTIEGNTGDAVSRQSRWLLSVGAEFVRVPGAAPSAPSPKAPRADPQAGPRSTSAERD